MTLDYLHLLSFVIALHLMTYRTRLAGHSRLKISNNMLLNLLPSPFFLPTTPECTTRARNEIIYLTGSGV